MLYQFRVRGHLDPTWAVWLDDVTIENCANGEAVLTAAVSDQAALSGLVNRIFALNLYLISLNSVRSEPPAERQPDETEVEAEND